MFSTLKVNYLKGYLGDEGQVKLCFYSYTHTEHIHKPADPIFLSSCFYLKHMVCGDEDGGMYLDISSIDVQRIPLGIQEPPYF